MIPFAGFVVIADDAFAGPSAIHPILQAMWPFIAQSRQLPYNHLYKDVTLSVLEMKELPCPHNGMLDHNSYGVKDHYLEFPIGDPENGGEPLRQIEAGKALRALRYRMSPHIALLVTD